MGSVIWIATGGTGGHIFPAIAIGQALLELRSDLSIHFVGADGGMETRLVPAAGFDVKTLPIRGLKRRADLKSLRHNTGLPWRTAQSVGRMRRWLRQSEAKLVVGTGGYASFPALAAARLSGIPYVVNEQNAFPGLVNRWFAGGAKRLYAGNAAVVERLKSKNVVVTGNPIRMELLRAREDSFKVSARAQWKLDSGPVLLVVGGSLGAAQLNRSIQNGLMTLASSSVHVVWQCGKRAYDELSRLTLPPNVRLMPFIDDMAAAYAVADVVVCRAGAITLSELAALSKPAILVPSPNVTDDHQTKNALSYSEKGAAVLVMDADAPTKLIPIAMSLLSDKHKQIELQHHIGQFSAVNAAEVIASDILTLV